MKTSDGFRQGTTRKTKTVGNIRYGSPDDAGDGGND
jgi:hypothetical protein